MNRRYCRTGSCPDCAFLVDDRNILNGDECELRDCPMTQPEKPASPCGGNPGAQWIRDAKATEGKVPMFEILSGFAPALEAIARVSVMGYHKHTKRAREKLIAEEGATPKQAAAAIPYNNWQNGTPATYADAGARHFMAELLGELKPDDSEELHLTHRAWNVLAELTLVLLRKGEAK